MVSQAASSLGAGIQAKLRELGESLAGVSEEEAGRRPADGEWCCKEVLSHLMGDEGEDEVGRLRRFLDEDNPLIGIVVGLPFYTPGRQAMSLAELRAGVWKRYEEMAEFVSGLSDEQLERGARIPLLKQTPIGEQATMAQWVGVVTNFHLPAHTEQVQGIRERLGK
jgi:hypothetical protein